MWKIDIDLSTIRVIFNFHPLIVDLIVSIKNKDITETSNSESFHGLG
jgi:hypothetical protein